MKYPNMEQWREAYTLADKVKELAPWEHLHDMDVFGFEHPDTGKVYLFSVMGAKRENIAVGIMADIKTWDVHRKVSQREVGNYNITLTYQLHLSYDSRTDVHPHELEVIKALGKKYRGRNEFPVFQVQKPGQYFWHVTAEELELMILALQRFLEMAPTIIKENMGPELFSKSVCHETFYIRKPVKCDGNLSWQNEWMHIPVEAESGTVPVSLKTVNKVKKLHPVRNVFEFDIFLFPNLIQKDETTAPEFPFVALTVVEDAMHVAGFETFSGDSAEKINTELAYSLIDTCVKNNVKPAVIRVRNESVKELIAEVAKALNAKVTVQQSLPGVDSVAEKMIGAVN